MQKVMLGTSTLKSSRLIYGCMRIAGDQSKQDLKKGRQAIEAAMNAGFTHFDHADIYSAGACETLFSEVLQENPSIRKDILLTGKCGIRQPQGQQDTNPKRYDFTKEHIISSVKASLDRLKTDYLDLLLLHRPDYLFSADDTAETFETLENEGIVRNFGVSNFSPSQLSLLQSRCKMPLISNQIEVNIHNINSLLDGTLDQCQQLNISPQAWCPLASVAYPAWANTFSNIDMNRINQELVLQAKKYGCDKTLIPLAWLLKLPSKVLPIIGSTTKSRIHLAAEALKIEYTREDWYRLLEARNGKPVD